MAVGSQTKGTRPHPKMCFLGAALLASMLAGATFPQLGLAWEKRQDLCMTQWSSKEKQKIAISWLQAGWLAAAVPDSGRDKQKSQTLEVFRIQPCKPAIQPGSLPTIKPAGQPARRPASQPSHQKTSQPTSQPASKPTSPNHPASHPTKTSAPLILIDPCDIQDISPMNPL